MRSKQKRLPPTPAEPRNEQPPTRRRQLLAIVCSRVEIPQHLRIRQTRHRLHHRVLIRKGSGPAHHHRHISCTRSRRRPLHMRMIFSLLGRTRHRIAPRPRQSPERRRTRYRRPQPTQQIRFDDNVSRASDLIGHLPRPIALPKNLVNHHHHRSLLFDLRIHHPGLQLASAGLGDRDILAMPRALGQRSLRPVLRPAGRTCKGQPAHQTYGQNYPHEPTLPHLAGESTTPAIPHATPNTTARSSAWRNLATRPAGSLHQACTYRL
jgi:hypothetical protein